MHLHSLLTSRTAEEIVHVIRNRLGCRHRRRELAGVDNGSTALLHRGPFLGGGSRPRPSALADDRAVGFRRGRRLRHGVPEARRKHTTISRPSF